MCCTRDMTQILQREQAVLAVFERLSLLIWPLNKMKPGLKTAPVRERLQNTGSK